MDPKTSSAIPIDFLVNHLLHRNHIHCPASSLCDVPSRQSTINDPSVRLYRFKDTVDETLAAAGCEGDFSFENVLELPWSE